MKKMVIMGMAIMLMTGTVGAQVHYTPENFKSSTHNQHLTPYQHCVINQQNTINNLSEQFDKQCMSTSDHCTKLHNNLMNADTITEMNQLATEYGKKCTLSTRYCNNQANCEIQLIT